MVEILLNYEISLMNKKRDKPSQNRRTQTREKKQINPNTKTDKFDRRHFIASNVKSQIERKTKINGINIEQFHVT